MTTEELLEQMEAEVDMLSDEPQQKCIIDPETREIQIPETYHILGVVSDEKTERVWFQCPKVVGDGVDLSQLQIRINFQNASGEKDQYIVEDAEIEADNIVFSWLLSRKVTQYQGTVSFVICAIKALDGVVTNEWNTTLAQSEVLDGIEVSEPIPSPEESDLISQLIEMMVDIQDKSTQALHVAQSIISGQLQQLVPTVNNHIIVFNYVTQERR